MGVDGVVIFAAWQLGAALDDGLDTYPQVDNADCGRLVEGDRLYVVRLRGSREAVELLLPVEFVEDLDCLAPSQLSCFIPVSSRRVAWDTYGPLA